MDSLVDVVNHIYDTLLGIDDKKLYEDVFPLKSKIDDWYQEHSGEYVQDSQIVASTAATSTIFCYLSC